VPGIIVEGLTCAGIPVEGHSLFYLDEVAAAPVQDDVAGRVAF